jgi:hypothetical protein
MVIYTRDVCNIFGKSIPTAWRILAKVRKAKKKSFGDPVTIDEFCEVMKMKEDFVREFLL